MYLLKLLRKQSPAVESHQDGFSHLISRSILDGCKLGPDTEAFIVFYREKEDSLAIQDQR